MTRTKLKDQKEYDNKIPDVASFIEITSNQLVEHALEIRLVLENESVEVLNVENPLDYLQIILELNGQRVRLPNDGTPRGVIDSRNPLPRPYSVTHIQISDTNNVSTERPIAEAEAKRLSIPGKSKYWITIVCDKVAQDAKEPIVFVRPRSGSYRISIGFSLYSDKRQQRLFDSGWLDAKVIEK